MKLLYACVALCSVLSSVQGVALEESLGLSAVMRDKLLKKNKKNSNKFNAPQITGNKATQVKVGGNKCQPDNARGEDRVCELGPNGVTPKSGGCVCKQECHLWGDPHISTFASPCTGLVMGKPDHTEFFTFWAHPGDKKNKAFKILVKSEKVKKSDDPTSTSPFLPNKVWVRQLYTQVGTNAPELLLDATTDCPSTAEFEKKREFWSDKAVSANKADSDVEVQYTFGCRPSNENHGVKQLFVRMFVNEENVAQDPADAQTQQSYPPPSTLFFANDFGMCTDHVVHGNPWITNPKPKDYELNCNRQSDTGLNGRVCECDAICGAFGDPYITDFKREGCRKTNKNSCNFQMPKKPTREEAIFYSVQERFAVEMILDECEFIHGVRVWILKENIESTFVGCSGKSNNVAALSDSDYEYYEILAKDHCSLKDTIASKRKTIHVPSSVDPALAQHRYDANKDGFNLGKAVLMGDGSLVPIPDNVGVSTCLGNKGFSKADVAGAKSVVNFGSVSLTLRCHIRAGRKDGSQYFNMCVNRKGVSQEDFIGGGKGAAQSLTAYNSNVDKNLFANLEKAARTGGWCATADYTKQWSGAGTQSTPMSQKSYELRKNGESDVFNLVKRDSTSSASATTTPSRSPTAQPASTSNKASRKKKKGGR